MYHQIPVFVTFMKLQMKENGWQKEWII